MLLVLITDAARSQYLGMVEHYLQASPRRAARPDAARLLIEAYDEALARIGSEPRSWLTHPRPYPDLARYGFRWIKLHRYWFAWQSGPPAVITNIFDETADIPNRVSDDGVPAGVA